LFCGAILNASRSSTIPTTSACRRYRNGGSIFAVSRVTRVRPQTDGLADISGHRFSFLYRQFTQYAFARKPLQVEPLKPEEAGHEDIPHRIVGRKSGRSC